MNVVSHFFCYLPPSLCRIAYSTEKFEQNDAESSNENEDFLLFFRLLIVAGLFIVQLWKKGRDRPDLA